MTLLFVVLGAVLGAPARYLTDRWVQQRHASIFPWGTWTVNVSASLILGAVVASPAAGGAWGTLLGVGFCGALSTYSTFGYETVRLMEGGAYRLALANMAASIAACLAAAFLGAALASALW